MCRLSNVLQGGVGGGGEISIYAGKAGVNGEPAAVTVAAVNLLPIKNEQWVDFAV